MAARGEPQAFEIVDLHGLRGTDLADVLDREVRDWKQTLDWDYRTSAELVHRFLDMRALTGYALRIAGNTAGYSYYISEGHKGLIGNLYVVERHRTPETHSVLFDAVVGDLLHVPHLRRIESQLMLMPVTMPMPMPRAKYLTVHIRNFMAFDLRNARRLQPGMPAARVNFETWDESKQEEAAHVIAAAYAGHIDSTVNDQYTSAGGAKQFLTNIVQYPGCGTFFARASQLAFEAETGRLCGLSLTSLLGKDVGHITQVCVAPHVRGTGVGYELLRRSLHGLEASGCRAASLTVTVANRGAVQLYERMGFEIVRQFPAMVWDGFGEDNQ
ncbi:MAG: GNAT family N-acetyltransferase [Bryobacteraceae bacterium]